MTLIEHEEIPGGNVYRVWRINKPTGTRTLLSEVIRPVHRWLKFRWGKVERIEA